jgi:uncharacterized protein (TIGR01777 family)
METVLITGGTGMIGKALTQALIERGFNVIILTRHINDKQKTINPVRPGHPGGDKLSYAVWDIEKQTLDKNALSKADYIVHLAGASVAEKRWTDKRKQEIVSSRVESGKLIVESLKTIPNKVKTVISATAIGWYGHDKNDGKIFTEDDPSSNDFLGQTCKQWEAAIEPTSFLGIRLVKLRIGIVLSNEGAAYVEFKKPLKFGLATILGSGTQIVSWIHIDDLVRVILFALENEKMEGVYNAVAPNPVTNKELVLEIAKKERGKSFLSVHVPTFALKIRLGEMSIEVLKSATVSSEKIQKAGFIFQYPDLESAILQLSSQKNPQASL